MKGDVIGDNDDDDEVRTKVSQKCVTATRYTAEFFLRTQDIQGSPLKSEERYARGLRK
jgi:hypothetical protein